MLLISCFTISVLFGLNFTYLNFYPIFEWFGSLKTIPASYYPFYTLIDYKNYALDLIPFLSSFYFCRYFLVSYKC